MKPGEIYWADLEFAGRHPVIVLSRESLNRGNTVVAVPCTSRNVEKRAKFANCVVFRAAEFGFTEPTAAQCENVQIIEKQILDPNPIGRVSDEALRDLICALALRRRSRLRTPVKQTAATSGDPPPHWRLRRNVPPSRMGQETVSRVRSFHVLSGQEVRSYAAHFIREAWRPKSPANLTRSTTDGYRISRVS